MFGIKKNIIDNLIISDKEESSDNNESLKEKNLKYDSKFIFYHEGQMFVRQLEIYAELNIKDSPKILILTNTTESTKELAKKISTGFEKYREYQDLKNLRVIKLNDLEISKDKIIENEINNGDVLYCDLDADEIWINTNIIMKSGIDREYKFSSEIKFDSNLTFKKFKFSLIKVGIENWLTQRKKQCSEFHFVISNISFENNKSNINLDINNQSDIDNNTIKSIFGFQGKITITIRFQTLEGLIFQKLKIINPKNENSKKWREFKKFNFNQFYYNDKFVKEKQFIIKKIKLFFQNAQLLNKLYLYHQKLNHLIDNEYDDIISTSQTEYTIIIIPFNNITNKRLSKRISIDLSFSKNENKLFKFKNNIFEIYDNDEDKDSNNLNKSHISHKNIQRKKKISSNNQQYVINSDLLQDFEANFSIDNFRAFIEDFYKIKIEKGELEKSITPKFRYLNDNSIRNNKSNESRYFAGYNRKYIKKINIHLLIYMIWLAFICILSYFIILKNNNK